VGQERERGREQKQLEQLGLIFPAASASSSSKVRGHRLCRGHTHCQCRQLGCECSPQALMPGWKCRNFVAVLEQQPHVEQTLEWQQQSKIVLRPLEAVQR